MNSSSLEKRFLGFDLIRAISMIAIVQFHANEAVFWTDEHPLTLKDSFYGPLEFYGRSLSYSGFTIIALSFFLIGLGRRRNFLALLGLIGIGTLVLASFQHDPPFMGFYWEWDIYWYLFTSALLIQAISYLPGKLYWLIGISFAMTWMPFWKWIPNQKDLFSQALVGICPPDGLASWPILPWIAWPLLFFALGHAYRHSSTLKEKLTRLQRWEPHFWAPLLLLSLPQWGAFYEVPIGPNFYCHTLRQEPYVFWSHLIWVVFAMRLSLITSVNQWLTQFSVVRFVSNLAWNRHFGICYITHLALLGLGILCQGIFLSVPHTFDFFWLGVFPATELMVRSGLFIKEKFKASSE